jgi:hypothetical protein
MYKLLIGPVIRLGPQSHGAPVGCTACTPDSFSPDVSVTHAELSLYTCVCFVFETVHLELPFPSVNFRFLVLVSPEV